MIPDTVTEIDREAEPFRGNPLITSVRIPGTVSCVSEYAFEGCIHLKKVVLEEGVTGIEGWAFSGCIELSEMSMPDSLRKIGSSAFMECNKKNCFAVHRRNTG